MNTYKVTLKMCLVMVRVMVEVVLGGGWLVGCEVLRSRLVDCGSFGLGFCFSFNH